jgi:hypothetical protein
MLTSSLPHGLFILILYFEGCLGINIASVVQSGNFIFFVFFLFVQTKASDAAKKKK